MPDDRKGRGFPDREPTSSSLTKKSPFEKAKAEAEAKRARERAETAAVYEDFVKSFEEDASAPTRVGDGRQGNFGGRGGGLGAARPSRHFSSSGARHSGPGTLPPPSTFASRGGQRGFGQPPHGRDSTSGILGFDPSPPIPSAPRSAFHSTSDDEDDRRADAREAEKAASRYTLCLESLPLGTSPSVLKSLIPSFLTVDNVNIVRPNNQSATERKSAAAIVTLASDTPLSDVNSAISLLDKKYLGRGHYLSIHKGHSSAAINSTLPTTLGTTTSKSLPFGAKAVQQNFGGSLSRAPPPGSHRGFAPPDSYGPGNGRGGGSTKVEVQAPADIKQLRLIHKTLEMLLNHGPEFEALLMSRPEVQKEEKWAWIWDARSPGGVYYRWKLWQIVTSPRAQSRGKTAGRQAYSVFDGGPVWVPSDMSIKFEYTTRLDEFVSEDDYNSSEEEMSDGEEDRRNLGGGPSSENAASHQDNVGYMNPLQKAKLTHLLARLPTTHARLRRGDVARVTAFAIKHAGTGAREVVDMIILNILHPLAYTGANPGREVEKDAARQEEEDRDGKSVAKTKIDTSSAKLVGLYLISDILASSATSGVPKGWRYRSLFENALRSHKVFEHLGRMEKDLNWGRLRAEKWKRSVGALLHLWEGWSIFQPSNQEHFLKVLEHPPPTEEELQKESEKADAEQSSHQASKSKSRWKTVDDDAESARVKDDPFIDTKIQDRPSTSAPAMMEDESMSDLDGVPLEDSDLEMQDDGDYEDEEEIVGEEENDHGGGPMEEDPSLHAQSNAQQALDDGPIQPEQHEGQVQRGQRRPRPKAEDMFASDSD
ncbi:hypothetical protein POX_b03209 [Penicillium oxalicum]|uniref:CID domain-containing protein n=1 Tax=Penicillium oxalicum (strain 114-2 / CGMCC 5302) TaxID=933388 RepID=S7ZHN2_PENO1|nr:hypothetical protein POX_b03209 [Penicillium oxalicum]EPS29769.1 hypothetical protein PDE_04719 [Penicillium oxalicum 114-2]KAI2793159.1 hypothetical protein POX_b03209 [Penicillium oxalicum]